jgi:3-deoxy-D-manno-octulosonate 8-phosphate phosphatase (KDO 8-P phosphatase)
MTFSDIENTFKSVGGEFVSSPILISKKLKKIKALVFDWDGVWHSGRKSGNGQSSFSEVDSMGLNMLRFGYYLQNGEIPKTLIITGENNLTAFDFAEREHLDAVFYKIKNKAEALDFLLKEWRLQEEEVFFAFDDILDLGMAKRCGVGYLINNTGNPLFIKHVLHKKWCDYKTAATGATNGVREIAELSLALIGKFEETLNKRMAFDNEYQTYFEQRNNLKTHFYSIKEKAICKVVNPQKAS